MQYLLKNLKHPFIQYTWMAVLLTGSLYLDVRAQAVRTPAQNLEYHRAEIAWKSGSSVLEAKARVDRVLREVPDDPEALKLRAQVLMTMERPREALEDARRAVGIAPRDGEAYLILCEAARLSGNKKLASEALDDAADRVLDSAELHVRLSWNAVELGQLEKAEAYARIALVLDASSRAGFLQLARVFMMEKKRDQAAEILVRGLRTSVLDVNTIQSDALLAPLASHRLLVSFRR